MLTLNKQFTELQPLCIIWPSQTQAPFQSLEHFQSWCVFCTIATPLRVSTSDLPRSKPFVRVTLPSYVQGRSSSASSFHASLLQAIDVLGFVPASRVSSSSALQIFREASLLWELLYPPVCLLGRFPSLRHVQGSTHTGVLEGGRRPFPSGFPIPLFTFCSKLIESVRMMAGAVRLPPLQANLRRAYGDNFTRTKFHLCFSVYIF